MLRFVLIASTSVVLFGACSSEPETLAETGLYEPGTRQIAAGVLEYVPRYQLWSDGARKRRYVQLPDGAKIDTSDPDAWVFPKETKLWKEFSVEGKLVETRFMHKVGDDADSWTFTAYVWDEAGASAAQPWFGGDAQDVRGTGHDVPKQSDCMSCHGGAQDRVLGFSAVQLAHDSYGVTSQTLKDADQVTDFIPAVLALPGTEEQQQALGYLHANCGVCHNGDMDLKLDAALRTDAMQRLEDTALWRTAVDKETEGSAQDWTDAKHIIASGDPGDSMLLQRMKRRGAGQMPPLASDEVDGTGTTIIETFIRSLAAAE
jgi:hypothetical protein